MRIFLYCFFGNSKILPFLSFSRQAGVQVPVGDAYAPVGDFEAEYRGAMEHAKSTVLNAVS